MPTNLLADILMSSKSHCVAVYYIESGKFKLNKGFSNLIGKTLLSEAVMNPKWDKVLSFPSSTEDYVFNGIITAGVNENSAQSLNGKIFKNEDFIVISLEYQVDELVSFTAKVSDFNREIMNLQRDLIKEKKQLKQTLKKLKIANEQKNELLGIAAHDLRNPIGAIKSFSDLLLYDDLDVNQMEIIQMINKSSDYMLYLITNLLDMSAFEAGKLNIKMSEHSYNDVIKEIISINHHYATSKDITLNMQYLATHDIFNFDNNKIMQVLNNLVGNAIKYSPPKTHVEVIVTDQGDFIKTEIKDQGVGIKEEELSLLFKAFSRTSSTPTGDETSTGLGLAITKKIVDGHNGEVGVESIVGVGSDFWFTIPISI